MAATDTAGIEPQELLEMMRRRRSSRTGFLENTEVPDETLELLLEAARAAPSGGNAQPWEFLVIRDKDMRMRIADLYKQQLTKKIELERAIRGTTSVSGVGWRNAPVLILVLGDPRTSLCFPLRTAEDKADSHFYSGLANATLQLMLMAESLGLSTQYVSDAASPYFSLMLKHLLGIPTELGVYHIVPAGYTEVIATPKSRRPLDSMVHYERYDAAKLRSEAYLESFAAEDSIQSKDYDRGGRRIG
ncbi:MAG: nitroreductase family protein [Alphaproteobacteria bacterium]